MQGKTHLAVGVLTAAIISPPETYAETVVCTCSAAVGSLVSDVDVTRSEAKNTLDKIILLMIGVVAVGVALNYFLDMNVYDLMLKHSSLKRILIGITTFITICIFGEKTPHRSFMHSILGIATLSLVVFIISPMLLKYFVPAMISHIIIDILNKKKVRIFFPLKSGVSLGLCKSDGIINDLMFYVGIAASCGVIALALFK